VANFFFQWYFIKEAKNYKLMISNILLFFHLNLCLTRYISLYMEWSYTLLLYPCYPIGSATECPLTTVYVVNWRMSWYKKIRVMLPPFFICKKILCMTKISHFLSPFRLLFLYVVVWLEKTLWYHVLFYYSTMKVTKRKWCNANNETDPQF
jgi:hypothetical protein